MIALAAHRSPLPDLRRAARSRSPSRHRPQPRLQPVAHLPPTGAAPYRKTGATALSPQKASTSRTRMIIVSVRPVSLSRFVADLPVASRALDDQIAGRAHQWRRKQRYPARQLAHPNSSPACRFAAFRAAGNWGTQVEQRNFLFDRGTLITRLAQHSPGQREITFCLHRPMFGAARHRIAQVVQTEPRAGQTAKPAQSGMHMS